MMFDDHLLGFTKLGSPDIGQPPLYNQNPGAYLLQ